MTHQQKFSDEILMAYADGELDVQTAQAVTEALETDPAISQRVALFSRTAALLGAAGQARPGGPVSPELAEKVSEIIRDAKGSPPDEDRDVLPFPSQPAPPRPFPMARYAMAASIALAVGLTGGYLLPRADNEPANASLLASLEAPAISAALSTLPSGERSALEQGEIEVVATFLNADDELCREFEYARADQTAAISVACLDDTRWQTRFAVVSGATDATGYVPASSLAALDAYLASVGAGAPMDSEEEMAALGPLD